jgi:hypothetical protein
MKVQLISSLADDDETKLAGAFVQAFAALLDVLPVAYSLRIETGSGRTFEKRRLPEDLAEAGKNTLGGFTARPAHASEH